MVNPVVICPTYTGVYFVNTTSNTTGGTATFNLTYNVAAIGTCKDLSGLSGANFTVSATSDNQTTITYGSKDFNTSTGLLTIAVTVKLGNNVYSAGNTFTLALASAPNYTISATCADPVLVTVSTNADGFVTGGGYIIPTNAIGIIGDGANGLRTNFGFNIKYNKASTNLQGNWNMIIRTATGLWQVKSSQPSSLVVSQVSATSYKADMVYSAANIKNLTTGVGYGTGTVNITVYDNGEPGSGIDQIFIKVTDGATTYYTSSSSAVLSNAGSIPKITAGNIQIHTLGGGNAKRDALITTAKTPQSEVIKPLSANLVVSAYPNPYQDKVRFVIQSPVSGQATLDVFNMLGQKVQNIFNGHVQAGIGQSLEYNVPQTSRGNLMYILRVGDQKVTGKLLH